tara:strand:- start:962 stop:1075 length:114 start_codon:yes stop_codon:yes gene_type:complete
MNELRKFMTLMLVLLPFAIVAGLISAILGIIVNALSG